MRQFCDIEDCEAIFEGFSDLAGTNGSTLINKASKFINAEITKFHPQASAALPSEGTSPNFHVVLATASEAIYWALNRRMVTSSESAEDGYWTVFHQDALAIIEEIKTGEIRLAPDPKLSAVGIGMTEAVTSTATSTWLESNSLVPMSYYEDDVYSRIYTITIESLGSTLKTSKFKWKTDMTVDTDWEAEGVFMNVSFLTLSHGVAVRFLAENFDSFEVDQTWKIECYPERDSKNKAVGIKTFHMER
ncbi:MAG: hypothetical protein KAU20_01215 [Nanoarchaeota archaeon]|nr:hypothetical protein [Nanoarchaeota archaeon]